MCMSVYCRFTHIAAAWPSINVNVYVSDGLCAPKLSVLNVRMLSWLTLSLYIYIVMSESV